MNIKLPAHFDAKRGSGSDGCSRLYYTSFTMYKHMVNTYWTVIISKWFNARPYALLCTIMVSGMKRSNSV